MLGSHLPGAEALPPPQPHLPDGQPPSVEHRRAHTLWFLGGAAALILVVGFFSFFTLGTVVSYDGQELAKVSSARVARDAASDLERRHQPGPRRDLYHLREHDPLRLRHPAPQRAGG